MQGPGSFTPITSTNTRSCECTLQKHFNDIHQNLQSVLGQWGAPTYGTSASRNTRPRRYSSDPGSCLTQKCFIASRNRQTLSGKRRPSTGAAEFFKTGHNNTVIGSFNRPPVSSSSSNPNGPPVSWGIPSFQGHHFGGVNPEWGIPSFQAHHLGGVNLQPGIPHGIQYQNFGNIENMTISGVGNNNDVRHFGPDGKEIPNPPTSQRRRRKNRGSRT